MTLASCRCSSSAPVHRDRAGWDCPRCRPAACASRCWRCWGRLSRWPASTRTSCWRPGLPFLRPVAQSRVPDKLHAAAITVAGPWRRWRCGRHAALAFGWPTGAASPPRWRCGRDGADLAWCRTARSRLHRQCAPRLDAWRRTGCCGDAGRAGHRLRRRGGRAAVVAAAADAALARWRSSAAALLMAAWRSAGLGAEPEDPAAGDAARGFVWRASLALSALSHGLMALGGAGLGLAPTMPWRWLPGSDADRDDHPCAAGHSGAAAATTWPGRCTGRADGCGAALGAALCRRPARCCSCSQSSPGPCRHRLAWRYGTGSAPRSDGRPG